MPLPELLVVPPWEQWLPQVGGQQLVDLLVGRLDTFLKIYMLMYSIICPTNCHNFNN
jgi:hypothetical protein